MDFGKLNSNFHISQSRTFDVSDLDTLGEVIKFQAAERDDLINELEEVAQREQDWRVAWRNQEQEKTENAR